uniref:DIS3-like exonuclease 1 n=1 Tax=Albugo laibachii Nc14 TaxID=890382 RepID=F0WJX6_9STRA|nr:DIS3like exonuclease 1 putative [Albugo laibachii Nc14]CCA24260.1 DIS3like exonuclease 1 putative [Albugo laibachii Nc14]|eukprot:CCA24260.1 DIS3like exonuclease 1 putative [Albugo laibachii Nc14]
MSSIVRPYGYATFDTWFYDKGRRRRRQGTLCCLERYVRTDLDCGITSCQQHTDQSKCQTPIGVIYLIPDAVSLYPCLQMLQKASEASSNDRMTVTAKEIVCDVFQHLIVLETCVLQAKEWLPSQEFSRLLSFMRDRNTEESRFVSFVANENSFYVSENWETSPHDILKARESRLIAGTLQWYASSHPDVTFLHLASAPSTELSNGSNMRAMSLEKYIESSVGDTDGRLVLELVQNMGQKVKDWIDVSEKSKCQLDEEDPLSDGLATEGRSESFSMGIFEVNAYCSTEAFVRLKNRNEAFNADSVYICGSRDMKRAVHGDVVKVQIFPKHMWKVPTTERVLVHYTPQVEDESDDNPVLSSSPFDDVMLSVESTASGWATGRIINVISRSHRVIIATIPSKMIKGGDNTALAIPVSMRFSKVRIRSNHLDILTDKRLKIIIDSWPIDSAYPHGHYIGILGNVQDVTTEVSAILVENELIESPFSQAAIACLPRISEAVMESYQIAECCTAKRPSKCPLLEWEIPTEEFEMSLRRDLRTTHKVFSVDPAGCQDIDDAMSISVLSNGNIELGVHIADVSYFVKPESALDCEARRRGTSVYLVGQRLDMIPAVLSADLCSLHHSRDRLAVSVIWEVNATSLAVVEDKTWIGRTAVRSCASLTYEQAHGILHNKPIPASSIPDNVGMVGGDIPNALKRHLREGLQHLTQIARTLERSRMQNGGLDLSRSEEVHIALGASNLKDPDVSVDSCENLEIHHTIAEIMILTNTTVAKKIFQAFPQHALLRRHLPPSSSRFSQVLDIARVNGIKFDPTTNSTLQQSILRCENSGVMDSKTMALLKSLVVREMQQAEYICAHEALAAPRMIAANAKDYDNRIAHYGLGVECYTHFTSPIRRYADIVVHRQLLQVVQESSKITKPAILLPIPQSASMPLDQSDELLDDLIAHVHGELIECRPEETSPSRDVGTPGVPLTDLIQMTHHLNVKHQSAKRASQQCKELFLALYFSENKIVTVGIITSLKENGFLVYLPEYDLRGPVYLCDRDNRVQINPSLCGVPWHDCGEPTGAFARSEYIRYIPHAKICMDGDNERLLLSNVNASLDEKPMCEFREFQHVEVQILCNNMDTQSLRIEPLQFLLTGIPGKKTRQLKSKRLGTHNEGQEKFNIEHHMTEQRWKTGSIPDASRVVRERSESPLPKTLYEVISEMKGSPSQHINPSNTKTIGKSMRPKQRGPGRFIFGSTSSHQPEIPSSSYQANYMKARSPKLEEAMQIRRGTAQPTTKHASAVVSEMEKDDGLGRRLGQAVQTRNFKLQAEKRHARVNKQKKSK